MFTFLTNTQFKIHEKANTRNSPHYFYDCKKLWYNNTVILSDHSIQKMTNDNTYRSEMIHKCYTRQNWSTRGINILDKNSSFPILIYLLTHIYFSGVRKLIFRCICCLNTSLIWKWKRHDGVKTGINHSTQIRYVFMFSKSLFICKMKPPQRLKINIISTKVWK